MVSAVPTNPEPATDSERGPSRRQLLKGAGALAVAGAATAAVGVGVWRSLGESRPAGPGAELGAGTAPSLDVLAANAISGGPPKDGIPAIDEPRFVAASQVDFLDEDEPVFGLELAGEVRAYPQRVLVWHEIVNDIIAGQPVSVTYCPLTGSVVAFTGQGEGEPLTFGTTGKLVNSNLLMYDRQTDSQWPQLLGVAVSGPLKAQPLTELPLVWASWGRWRAAHPGTTVLGTDTGFARDYGADPYGSYLPPGGYYTSGGPIFPVLSSDDRFPAKDVVVGVKTGQSRVAIHKERVQGEGAVEFMLAGVALRAVWDEELATGWIAPAEGVGRGMTAVSFLDVMWFAWRAFYPDTEIIG